MAWYVYSTATCSGSYVEYHASKDVGTIKRKVTIQGGHGVASLAHHGALGNIHTPQGVVTEVSDDDMEFLKQDKNFLRHVAAGHMKFEKKKIDPAKAISDMNLKDGSAPLTPADFDKSDNSDKDTPIYKKKDVNDAPDIISPAKKSARK